MVTTGRVASKVTDANFPAQPSPVKPSWVESIGGCCPAAGYAADSGNCAEGRNTSSDNVMLGADSDAQSQASDQP